MTGQLPAVADWTLGDSIGLMLLLAGHVAVLVVLAGSGG